MRFRPIINKFADEIHSAGPIYTVMRSEHLAPERFIPFRKAELIERIISDGKLDKNDRARFRKFCDLIKNIYHFEFRTKEESLIENYFPFNPDKDKKSLQTYFQAELDACEKNLVDQLREILIKANYKEITEQDWSYAMKEEFFSDASFKVDMTAFEQVLLFWRGSSIKKEKIKKWFFKTVEIDLPVFERLFILIKARQDMKPRTDHTTQSSQNREIMIKLFRDIPRADLEMLFPNAQIQMKVMDWIIMGGALGIGGIGVILKAGAGLVAFFLVLYSLIVTNFTGGPPRMPDSTETAQLIGGISSLGILAAFLWKQWNNYKNRKIRCMKSLSDSLYFKNLDNNAGVFHHLIYAAESEEAKEAVLAYYFLLVSQNGMTRSALDQTIENWFYEKIGVKINFEINDALAKLRNMEICHETDGGPAGKPTYQVPKLQDALKQMDDTWDHYFKP
jgi:hypothetical protein